MDVDSDQVISVSNVDDWLARFSLVAGSRPGAFPFTSHKIQSIESRRARMADLLIFDVLLIRGGIHSPDMLFPPADWPSLRKFLEAIDQSVYDILKKDCLVYILLKWAWDIDPKENNPGWDARYVQDQCIAPQFAALADAYWLLDTGTHLAKAVSILADARLNRDYVSKILQALALSSSPTSFASGSTPGAATLIVSYVRAAKPLLTEPDDIDLYALSLAQLSFMDAWAYQKSFPEGCDTRERLLRKIIGWSLMPTPKQEPLAQLVAFPLSSYEQSALYSLALPSQFSTSSSLSSIHTHTTTASGLVLSSQGVSVLQDLLCVRAIQSGDYVRAIKLDREFSSVSSSLGSATSLSNIASQSTSSGRDPIDRKSIIQDLFAMLPPAERTLLEDELGKVATGVRANTSSTFTPRQGVASSARRPLTTEPGLSASWEDVGTGAASHPPSAFASVSVSSSAVGASFAGKAAPVPVSTTTKVALSPFASHMSRPQPTSSRQAQPKLKFTALVPPIPSAGTGVNTERGASAEFSKTLFATSATGRNTGPSRLVAARVSLFETAGSAKNAPNAFYNPRSVPPGTASLDVASALASSRTTKSPGRSTNMATQNGTTQQVEHDGEDVRMGSRSDVEIVEEGHRDGSGDEDQEEAVDEDQDEDDSENFITHDKSGAADLTLLPRRVDEAMNEDDGAEVELEFSVFGGSRNAVRSGRVVEYPGKKGGSRNGHALYATPPPRTHVSPPRQGDKSLNASVHSTTSSRRHALPGAFHHEDEDEDEGRRNESDHDHGEDADEEDDRASQTPPFDSPRRTTRTWTQARSQTHPQPSVPPHPQPTRKNGAYTTTSETRRPSPPTSGRTSSNRPSSNQPIPGSLMGEDDDAMDQGDRHGDDDTEMDEQEEDVDAVAPLPSRVSRRTRSSGNVGAPTTTTATTKSKSSAKGKTRARPSEVKTPARRSSRLSTASSLSPDHPVEVASPTKKGRKSIAGASRGSMAGSGSAGGGIIATRSTTRRKR